MVTRGREHRPVPRVRQPELVARSSRSQSQPSSAGLQDGYVCIYIYIERERYNNNNENDDNYNNNSKAPQGTERGAMGSKNPPA